MHYLCAYYSQWAHEHVAPRSAALWDAYQFCRAVKLGTINGYLTAPTRPKPTRIDSGNVREARKLFGGFIEQVIPADQLRSAIICPVPSKDSFNTDEFRSLVMLRESLGPAYQSNIRPLVRYNTQLQSASQGGERGYDACFPFLSVTGCFPRDSAVILVDDILTTGGTLLATRDRLIASGALVNDALVCGKTTAAMEPAFKIRDFVVEDGAGEIAFQPAAAGT